VEENDKATLELLTEARKMQKIVSGKTLTYKEILKILCKWSVDIDEEDIKKAMDEVAAMSDEEKEALREDWF